MILDSRVNSKFGTLLWGQAVPQASYMGSTCFNPKLNLGLQIHFPPKCTTCCQAKSRVMLQLQECSALLALKCGASVPKASARGMGVGCQAAWSISIQSIPEEWKQLSTRTSHPWFQSCFLFPPQSVHFPHLCSIFLQFPCSTEVGRPSCMAASPRKWSHGGSPATSKRRTCNLGFTVVTARDPSARLFYAFS